MIVHYGSFDHFHGRLQRDGLQADSCIVLDVFFVVAWPVK